MNQPLLDTEKNLCIILSSKTGFRDRSNFTYVLHEQNTPESPENSGKGVSLQNKAIL